MAASIAFSRRVFLSLIGLASVFAVQMRSGVAQPAQTPTGEGELIVVRGWVLRRDDLDRLGPR